MRQVRFKSCFYKNLLAFDFLVKISDNIGFLIEYNGLQHYEPARWSKNVSDAEILENFELVQKRDTIKREWAKERNIPLLIIPYWDKNNVKKYC